MRKLLSILLFITLFISCSSDDNNEDIGTGSKLAGYWELKESVLVTPARYDLTTNSIVKEEGCIETSVSYGSFGEKMGVAAGEEEADLYIGELTAYYDWGIVSYPHQDFMYEIQEGSPVIAKKYPFESYASRAFFYTLNGKYMTVMSCLLSPKDEQNFDYSSVTEWQISKYYKIWDANE